ncbi:hypothetical protein [Streptomyces sp. PvR034]|uniref:hypothetical protein n=1 Tax=Streptomyces sp. PvR034 TaxID=3156401 RepID=UPI0033965CAD
MREIPANETFGHVDHPGTVAGTPKHTRTAYVRAADGLEFTAAPDTPVAVSRICAVCDRPIRTGGREFVRHPASGARPSDWVHDLRDPACEPVRAGAR